MNEKLERLRSLLAGVDHVDQSVSVLAWDQQVNMPPGAAADRANQLATLNRIRHSMFTTDEIGRLLDDLSAEMKDADPDSDEARLLKVTREDYEHERKLPDDLVEKLARASSEGQMAWHRAREEANFKTFEPFLKRNIDLNRQVAEAYGYEGGRPYDAFLARTDPGITTAQLDTVFSELKQAIVPLVRQIAQKADAVDDSCVHQNFDPAVQLPFGLSVAQRFGYDLNRGRLDLSEHPFMINFGLGDIRITTRVFPDFLNPALFAIMHESGHAMYEQGIDLALGGTPLAHGGSSGLHESQSRLWENLVGRSRSFQDYLFPSLQETYPAQLGRVDIETFYRAINKVQPSFIRVEADEVTYNLHIILRYELETQMLDGTLDIGRLDEIWNERMEQYLGIAPPNATEGVLQDIHWSYAGEFNFPGYTLGNLIGAQLFEQAHKDLPGLDAQISRGEFAALLGWLRTNVHRHGRKFTANEIMQRVTGEPVSTRAWINYVTGKFSDIYAL